MFIITPMSLISFQIFPKMSPIFASLLFTVMLTLAPAHVFFEGPSVNVLQVLINNIQVDVF